MRAALAVASILLLCPAAPAQAKPPEELLPADSILYLRFDGLEAHRQAYEKTVVYELLQEDLGDFLGYIASLLKKQIIQQAANTDNELVKKALQLVGEPTALLKYAEKHGAVVALEVLGHSPPRWQATLVLPEAATP
jgi:hypothetical protein